MQRDREIGRTDFLSGIDATENAADERVDLTGFVPKPREATRPSAAALEAVARSTGFDAGLPPRREHATAQFAVRIYPSTFAEIEAYTAEMGWSKRVFIERALRALRSGER